MTSRTLRPATAFLVFCIAAPSAIQAQTTYYVRTSGSDLLASGLSPAKAFRTIQRAVGACSGNSGGYTIYVGPGTYSETVTLTALAGAGNGTVSNPNKIIGDISGAQTGDSPGEILVFGGGNRNYGIQASSRNYWEFSNLTIRDQKLYGANIAGGRGFTFTNCTIKPPGGNNVGIYATSTDILLEGNTFERSSGGGHCAYIAANASGFVTFRNNRFNLSGAAYLSSLFRSAKGWSNQAWNPASITSGFSVGLTGFTLGMVVMSTSASVATAVTMENNVGTDCMTGLGAYVTGNQSSSVSVSSNTVTGCTYPIYVVCDSVSRGALINNIATDSYYPACANIPGGRIDGLLQNNIAATLPSTSKWALGVITGDPRFVDAPGGNFGLLAASPAIDVGSTWSVPTHDIRRVIRPWDGDRDGVTGYDLGAYEFAGSGRFRITMWNQRDQLVVARDKLPNVAGKPAAAPNPKSQDSDGDGILDILSNVIGGLFGK